MRRGELFDLTELRVPFSPDQKETSLRLIINAARLGTTYTYTIKEAACILFLSRDVMDYLIHTYRLDALLYRDDLSHSWYSLAEYMIDSADDIDEDFNEFIRSRLKSD